MIKRGSKKKKQNQNFKDVSNVNNRRKMLTLEENNRLRFHLIKDNSKLKLPEF
jgi:hypothetical protein